MEEPSLFERLAMNLYGVTVSYHFKGRHPGTYSKCPDEICRDMRALLAEAREAVDGRPELWA